MRVSAARSNGFEPGVLIQTIVLGQANSCQLNLPRSGAARSNLGRNIENASGSLQERAVNHLTIEINRTEASS